MDSSLPSSKRAWEGLGGPICIDRSESHHIDPMLDACCRRDRENEHKKNATIKTLQRFDVTAERERRRLNLVQMTSGFSGCRCCFDPNADGTGDYQALLDLRAIKQIDVSSVPSNTMLHGDREADEKPELPEGSEGDEHKDIDDFDYLLDEDVYGQDSELKDLLDARRAELEATIYCQEIALQHGYGAHRQMHPMRVLKAAGLVPGASNPPQAVVLHLFDPDSLASASLDLYLERLAAQEARGTKFLRSGGRSVLLMEADLVSKVLSKLHVDRDIPALIAIRDGMVVNICPRLSSFLSSSLRCNSNLDSEIVPEAVYHWLDCSGVLLRTPPLHVEELCRIRPEESALLESSLRMKDSSKDNVAEFFDCGVSGCGKTYYHEHVGVVNNKQTGLVIKDL